VPSVDRLASFSRGELLLAAGDGDVAGAVKRARFIGADKGWNLGCLAYAEAAVAGQAGDTARANELARAFDGADDVAAALRRYAGRRRVRTRQIQLLSWAASAALHLPDGPATRDRDAYLAQLPHRLAWIHAYDALGSADREHRPP